MTPKGSRPERTAVSTERLRELIEWMSPGNEDEHDAYFGGDVLAALRELLARREREATPFTVKEATRFDNAPCFICGYNGANYYQPEAHPCALRYHAHHTLAAHEGEQDG